ncbi:MAG: MMPL family transporter [Deltaproteobacteria bacterium]|nr:MMPL family transporter [Deltaproteobacteria bacterium]
MLIILACVAVCVLVGSGARHLHFSANVDVYFDKDSPELLARNQIEDIYGSTLNVLLVYVPPEGDVFDPENLAVLHDLTEAAWLLPHVRRVDSVTNYQHSEASPEGVHIGALVEDPASLTPAERDEVRAIATSERQLVHWLVSPDATAAGVNATVQLPGVDRGVEVPEVAMAARRLAATMQERQPGARVEATGVLMINQAIWEGMNQDARRLIPLMFVLVVLFLALLTRSASATAASVLVVAGSTAVAMGSAGWAGMDLSPTNLIVPIVIMALAIASSVHLLEYYREFLAQGAEPATAAVRAQCANLSPIFWTTLSTVLGFLSLNASDAPPIRALGNMVALGMVASLVLSLWMFPALMRLLPRPSPRTASTAFLERLADRVLRHRRPLLAAGLILAAVAGAGAFQNVIDDDFIAYWDRSTPFRRATQFCLDHLTGFATADYSLGAGEPDGISRVDYLHKLAAFEAFWREQPKVRYVTSITRVFERLNKNLHGDDPAWERIPEDPALAAQYLLLYEMSLPYGLDLTDQISIDKSASRLSVVFTQGSSREFLEVEARARAWMEDNLPPEMWAPMTGQTLMFTKMSYRNAWSMLRSNTVVLAFISLLLMVPFRSIRIGLATLLPNLLPLAMGFAIWWVVDGRIGLAVSVVVGMTLGVVVDDTVHFTNKYLEERRVAHATREEAVRRAYRHVGIAMLSTSVVLVVGFSVLTLSRFTLNSSMGGLSAVIIALALVADLLFLGPLLMAVDRGE